MEARGWSHWPVLAQHEDIILRYTLRRLRPLLSARWDSGAQNLCFSHPADARGVSNGILRYPSLHEPVQGRLREYGTHSTQRTDRRLQITSTNEGGQHAETVVLIFPDLSCGVAALCWRREDTLTGRSTFGVKGYTSLPEREMCRPCREMEVAGVRLGSLAFDR